MRDAWPIFFFYILLSIRCVFFLFPIWSIGAKSVKRLRDLKKMKKILKEPYGTF